MSSPTVDAERESGIEVLGQELPSIDWLISHGAEVIGEREGGLIDCWVPTDLVDNEEVPVKEDHVVSIMGDMNRIAKKYGGTGQLSPIVLGLAEGEEKLRIIDGFHRSAALKMRGDDQIYATVKLTDLDTLYDERIFNAIDHSHVKFSRVIQWVRESWQISGLADDLTVEQAILLFRFQSSGKKLQLTEEQVERAKAWVSNKETQWGIKAMTIHDDLKIAEQVHPSLVHSTREKKRGDILEAPTKAILQAFSKIIPKQFDLQLFIMDIAKQQNLVGPKVKHLCSLLNGKSLDEAASATSVIDWDTFEGQFSDTKNRSLRRAADPRHKGARVFDAATDQIDKVAQRVGQFLDREEDITPEMRAKIAEAQSALREMIEKAGSLALELEEIVKPKLEIADLDQTSNKFEQAWGLTIREYEGDAPTIFLRGKGLYDLTEIESYIMSFLTTLDPGTQIGAGELQIILKQAGVHAKELSNLRKMNGTLHELRDKLDRHQVPGGMTMQLIGKQATVSLLLK